MAKAIYIIHHSINSVHFFNQSEVTVLKSKQRLFLTLMLYVMVKQAGSLSMLIDLRRTLVDMHELFRYQHVTS